MKRKGPQSRPFLFIVCPSPQIRECTRSLSPSSSSMSSGRWNPKDRGRRGRGVKRHKHFPKTRVQTRRRQPPSAGRKCKTKPIRGQREDVKENRRNPSWKEVFPRTPFPRTSGLTNPRVLEEGSGGNLFPRSFPQFLLKTLPSHRASVPTVMASRKQGQQDAGGTKTHRASVPTVMASRRQGQQDAGGTKTHRASVPTVMASRKQGQQDAGGTKTHRASVPTVTASRKQGQQDAGGTKTHRASVPTVTASRKQGQQDAGGTKTHRGFGADGDGEQKTRPAGCWRYRDSPRFHAGGDGQEGGRAEAVALGAVDEVDRGDLGVGTRVGPESS